MPVPVRILAFGDNVVDCYGNRGLMFPGGNCVNHAVFAARAGAEAIYAGAVADDPAGRLIRKSLLDEGVDVALLRMLPGQTAYCVIDTHEGERIFVGANLGVSIIAPGPADLARMAASEAVHTGRSSHVDAWLPRMAKATRVSYDMATVRDPGHIGQVAPYCFLMAFSGGDLARAEAAALAASARQDGAVWALVTRGNAGALLTGPTGTTEVAAQPVQPIDTLGAGDAFIARTLVGLLRDEAPEDLLHEASSAASETCLAQGAFGHAARMEVDLSGLMSLEEVYRTTRPAEAPPEG